MDVRCDKCGTEYEFDGNRIGNNGVTVKCTACGYVFKVRRPLRKPPPRASTTIGKGPQGGKEWLVRKPDGQMIAFRELTTLQKWIVEGRISRNDEISKNGETWKRLGNIMELEPFFSVYEKAKTLNTLIDQGGNEAQHLQLRGSELLSPSNPIPSAVPNSGQPVQIAQAIPSALTGSASPINPSHFHPKNTQQAILQADGTTPPMTAPPGAAPMSATSAPVPLTAPSTSAQAQNPNITHAPTAPQTVSPLAQKTPEPPSRSHTPIPAMTLPGPTVPPTGDLPSNGVHSSSNGAQGASGGLSADLSPSKSSSIQPAALGELKNDLSFPITDDPPLRHDPVENFQQGQKRRKLAVFGLLVLFAGAGALVATALYGPPDNPIRKMALRYDLIQSQPKPDPAAPLLEKARLEEDLDTLKNLEQASALLAQVQKLRRTDTSISADRALLFATRAAAFERWAVDLDAAAARSEEALKKWTEATRKTRGAKPPKPSVPDAASLRTEAKQKRTQRDAMLKTAESLLPPPNVPETLEIARAKAAIARTKGDEAAFQEALNRAKSSAELRKQTDAATLFLEASALVKSDRPKALSLLDKALNTRPKMNRARVMLARIHLMEKALPKAKTQVEQVLRTAPEHAEAKRLQARATTQVVAAPPPPPEATPPPKEAPKVVKDYDYWMRQADRLRRRNRTKAAMNAYGRAAELNTRSAEPLTGKGWCFIDLGRPQVAKINFQKALKVNDRYVEARYGLAEAYRAMNKNAEAVESCKLYLQRAPANASDRSSCKRIIERFSP